MSQCNVLGGGGGASTSARSRARSNAKLLGALKASMFVHAVLDITGDCRDEIVVWDPYEIWVYTQSDSPKAGTLYKPIRNALYNYSNYQATVSLPAWSE